MLPCTSSWRFHGHSTGILSSRTNPHILWCTGIEMRRTWHGQKCINTFIRVKSAHLATFRNREEAAKLRPMPERRQGMKPNLEHSSMRGPSTQACLKAWGPSWGQIFKSWKVKESRKRGNESQKFWAHLLSQVRYYAVRPALYSNGAEAVMRGQGPSMSLQVTIW